jgi:hypothetical protein
MLVTARLGLIPGDGVQTMRWRHCRLPSGNPSGEGS